MLISRYVYLEINNIPCNSCLHQGIIVSFSLISFTFLIYTHNTVLTTLHGGLSQDYIVSYSMCYLILLIKWILPQMVPIYQDVNIFYFYLLITFLYSLSHLYDPIWILLYNHCSMLKNLFCLFWYWYSINLLNS